MKLQNHKFYFILFVTREMLWQNVTKNTTDWLQVSDNYRVKLLKQIVSIPTVVYTRIGTLQMNTYII